MFVQHQQLFIHHTNSLPKVCSSRRTFLIYFSRCCLSCSISSSPELYYAVDMVWFENCEESGFCCWKPGSALDWVSYPVFLIQADQYYRQSWETLSLMRAIVSSMMIFLLGASLWFLKLILVIVKFAWTGSACLQIWIDAADQERGSAVRSLAASELLGLQTDHHNLACQRTRKERDVP
jgi:hypothetical protein